MSDKAKHTPGPWFMRITANQMFVSGANQSKDVVIVCKYSMTPEEREANARLIAAAPDMLEALKRIHATFRTDHKNMTTEEKKWANEYANDDGKTEAMLRAAIARHL